MASLCTVRQVKTCTTTGPRPRPMMRRDLVSPWLALIGLGVGDFLRGVSIGDGADVPPVGESRHSPTWSYQPERSGYCGIAEASTIGTMPVLVWRHRTSWTSVTETSATLASRRSVTHSIRACASRIGPVK